MSKKAQTIWNQIPESTKEQLIDNVFCRSCGGASSIVDFKTEMAEVKNDIVLQGKCKKCGNQVARYIESE